ncbi:hypothetical protein V6N11_068978 [Hibiscus sabdariffa]|uniref:Peptidase A1 domain-containing protein n=1 Tax=Hibiscus sabdariffa TaxID=183260 RepID=A0ABR2PBD0_9ROSI
MRAAVLSNALPGRYYPQNSHLPAIRLLLSMKLKAKDVININVNGLRAQGKHKQIQRRKSSKPNLLELPLRSAADLGAAQYFVTMRIGTPPKEFRMSVSTCSVLTWIKCSNCSSGKELSDMRFYQPNKSRTFRNIPCSSSFCTSDLIPSQSNDICPKRDAPCRYDYRHKDGTRLVGTIGNDTVTIRMKGNQKVILENVTIGCTKATKLQIDYPLDGLLGLCPDRQSFAGTALRQTRTTSFSYCLVDSLSPINVSSYLVFGGSNRLPNMQETDLLMGHWTWSIYYHLNVTGISLDGKMLHIPSDMWLYNPNGRSGVVILDIGTSLTALAAPVYDNLIRGLLPSISKFKKVKTEENNDFKHCFNSTGFNETLVPKLRIHFGNGAKFEPPVKNYVIGQGIKCLGFIKFDAHQTSIIGNLLQQNHFWEFDFPNYKLKFAPSTCISD